ncbi:energy transducer TonB [Anabaenopsis elenkinii]|uniref:TonB family protein n=1 Tax=Anabaenopsis elenkinii CCIBt3563 TaxID=2779889 RepID=A0A7S6RDK4_9CYAN|nr:energy transducer TonB [Anabaenopsis elenkinii]QOV22972.1 TonB family protein [Anabaenopsis elenkinii CCIBt3563]
MSFSSITLEYRSQEVKTLKYFLIYSLIGSLVLHIGVLSSLLAYLLRSNPQQIEDQPIEVVMIDFPIPEVEKPPAPIPQPERLPEPRQIITSNHTSPSPARNQTVTQSKPEITQQQPVVTLRQTPITPPPAKVESVITPTVPPPTPQTTATVSRLQSVLSSQTSEATTVTPPTQTVESVKTPPVSPPTPTNTATVSRLQSVLSSQTSEATTVTPPTQSSEKLQGVLTGIRDSRVTPGNNATVNTVESNQPSGTSALSTPNTGTSTNTVSVQPSTPPTPLPSNTRAESTNRPGNSRRSSSGRAACVRCNTNYPEFARRQGIEGRPRLSVDIDAQGNVTNVRILRSSGNRRLDQEIKRQASNWKLQPTEGGRQGISIDTNLMLEGSQRHRQVQERKRKQETSGSRETSRQTESSGSSPTASTSTPTRSNPVRRVRQQPQTEQNTAAGSSSGQGKTPTPGNVRDSLRNTRRQETSTNSVTPPGETSTNPPLTTNNTSSSQNQLRDALRRSRQPAELTPPTSSPESE